MVTYKWKYSQIPIYDGKIEFQIIVKTVEYNKTIY